MEFEDKDRIYYWYLRFKWSALHLNEIVVEDPEIRELYKKTNIFLEIIKV